MTDWSAIDARLGRDRQAADEPNMDEHERVAAAADGGAGGWEAFDNPDTGPDGGPDSGRPFEQQDAAADDSAIEVPARAYEIANYARMHNDAAPPGYKAIANT